MENYFSVAFSVIIMGGICGLLFCTYMLWRNIHVSNFRNQLIKFVYEDEDGEPSDTWIERRVWYNNLPDYDTMMNRFWIWPLEKFITGRFAEDYFNKKFVREQEA